MPRHSNQDWSLPEGTPNEGGGRTHSYDAIHSALLMDIRDELRTLNRVFACPNFIRIPRVLDAIRRNTAKKKKPNPQK